MKKIILSILLLASATLTVPAAVVFSEDFNGYSNGALVGNSGSPWVTHSGTAGTLLVENQKVKVNGTTSASSEDAHATFPGSPIYGSNSPAYLYTSFTVMWTNLPNAFGTYFAHLSDSGSANFRCRVFAAATNVASSGLATPGNFFVGIGNSS